VSCAFAAALLLCRRRRYNSDLVSLSLAAAAPPLPAILCLVIPF
jgi:hypothetical protein